jgi:hypothetical protein
MREQITVHAQAAANRLYKLSPVEAGGLDQPEFIRLPSPRGRCRYCGLSRTTLTELLPHIRHVRLRKDGSKRAIILIHLASLRKFLEERMSEPKPASVKPRAT